MSSWTAADIVLFLAESTVVFYLSTVLFDGVHYLLHRWERSRFSLLRRFSSWHDAHHRFLDRRMRLHSDEVRANTVFHLIPEYATSVVGTALLAVVFRPAAVLAVVAVHTLLFVVRLVLRGVDPNHREMDRIKGTHAQFVVDASYHALHHIYPNSYFSSFITVVDLVLGQACELRERRFLVTGSSGAFGSEMVRELKARGAEVRVAKSGRDFVAGDCAAMTEDLAWADVLILAHGTKSEGCWDANYRTFVELVEAYRDAGRDRLVPPEVWAVGSEAEFHGSMGITGLVDYARSKKAYSRVARGYRRDADLVYRHIVPSAFRSKMGPGLMSARTAVLVALFFIRRGARYVPVTYTTLALWNYIPFRLGRAAPSEVSADPTPSRAETRP